MKEIKFRGKSLTDGKWVYGSFIKCCSEDCYIGEIESVAGNSIKLVGELCDSETVGQFTGLFDSDKVEIYEGDIVFAEGGESCYGAREFVKTITINNLIYDTYELSHYEDLKVIDNIYENGNFLGDK
jgi:hypothetical protein